MHCVCSEPGIRSLRNCHCFVFEICESRPLVVSLHYYILYACLRDDSPPPDKFDWPTQLGRKQPILVFLHCFFFFFFTSCLYTTASNTAFKMMETDGPFKYVTVNMSHAAGSWVSDATIPFYWEQFIYLLYKGWDRMKFLKITRKDAFINKW